MNDPRKYFLTTSRLGFRCWREDDLPLALELWGDYEVMRYIDARGRLTTQQVLDRLGKEMATAKEYGVQYWPLFLLATDEHLGCCGLRPYDSSNAIYEIGSHIRSAHWRRGYAAEAAGAIIQYAFAQLGASALFAGHHPQNEASRLLLQKLGFHFTHHEFYPPTGLEHPSYLLKAEEFAAARRAAQTGAN